MVEREGEISPALVIEYTDPVEGFRGWLVRDTLAYGICAGGMRVQTGLSRDRLARMAQNMTRKMRISGLRVDGAKCGIDYDPAAPGKHAAMARFMTALRPYIESSYSMGPDLNVDMAELEAIGRQLGLASVKMAVARAQGWHLDYYNTRYAILKEEVDGQPLARLRVGYGVAVAGLAVLDHLGIAYPQATATVQGFGALAKAALYGLARKGVRIVALADAEKCIIAEAGQGLDVSDLLRAEGTLLPILKPGGGVRVAAREEIFQVPCDILVPAAVENTVSEAVAGRLQVRAVVPGANLAVTPAAEALLTQAGILVLPDFLSGCGGSLAMEGLFGPPAHPAPEKVLAHLERRMGEMVTRVLARSASEQVSPTVAALRICAEIIPQPGRPYGEPCC